MDQSAHARTDPRGEDFRGLTPGRTWEASDADAAIAVIFGHWFEDGDEIARRRQRPDM